MFGDHSSDEDHRAHQADGARPDRLARDAQNRSARGFAAALFAVIVAWPLVAQLQVASETPILQETTYDGLLSSDGKLLAFGRRGLIVRALESRQERQILPPLKSGALVAWSPDNKFIYFLNPGDKPWMNDLWRIEVDKGATERMAQHVSARPALSPDGLRVAFRRDDALLVADVDGRNQRTLCDACQAGRVILAWSLDGSSLALASSSYVNKESKLFLVDVQSGKRRQIARSDRMISGIVWSPAAEGLLACMFHYDETRPQEPGQIWRVAVPSGEATQLTHDRTGFGGVIGGTSDGMSVLALRMHPRPGYWENMMETFFGIEPGSDGINGTVLLHLKK